MMDELKEARELIWRSPYSIERIGLIENAIRLADSLGADEEAFDLRSDLISACTEYGQFLKALVAFSWCLGKIDEDPEKYPFNYNAIWDYQALLCRAAAFDQISLERLMSLHEDYERRMMGIGASERNIHEIRIRSGLILRDRDMALTARDGIKHTDGDRYSECDACAQNSMILTEAYFGKYEDARKLMQPLLDKKMSCNMVPLRTYGCMINHVYRSGDTELAKQIYSQGIRLIGKKGGFLEQIGNYLIYLSVANKAEGRKIYERSLPWALNETEMPWSVFHFHMGAHILFKSLLQTRKTGKMQLPNLFKLYSPDGEYEYSALAEYHLAEAQAFAQRFDKRNGNTIASDMLNNELARA